MEKYYQPKKLSPRHYAIMRELIAGTNQTTIARLFRMTINRINVIVNCPRFKEAYEVVKREIESKFIDSEGNRQTEITRARTKLDNEIAPSIKKVVELRDGAKDERVQLGSATQLLDRAGVQKVEKVAIVHGEMEVSDNLVFALGLREVKNVKTDPEGNGDGQGEPTE